MEITQLSAHMVYLQQCTKENVEGLLSGSSFHNLAAEVPKRHFPNRMDLFLYGTSDVNAVDRKDLLGLQTLSMSRKFSGAQPFNDLKVKSSILN